MLRHSVATPLLLALVLLGPTPASAAPSDPIALLAEDTRIVMHLDANQLMKRGWVKAIVRRVAALPRVRDQLKAFTSQYGIDPLRAIGDLTIAFPDRSRTGLPLWVIKGQIDPKKLLDGAKKQTKLKTRKKAGLRYYTAPDNTALAFVRGHTLVGDRGFLERALAAAPKKKGPRDKTFYRLLAKTNQGHGAWFVGSISKDVRTQLGRRTRAMGSMKQIRGTVNLAQGVKMNLVAHLSPADAQWVLARAQRELKQQRNSTMVRLSGLSLLLERITLGADGGRLTMDLDLSEAEITRLQTPLAMLISVFVAGHLPSAPQKRVPPGQPIRRVEKKQK